MKTGKMNTANNQELSILSRFDFNMKTGKMNTANNQELSILSRFDFNKFKGVYYYGSWRFQSYQGSILTLIQSLVKIEP